MFIYIFFVISTAFCAIIEYISNNSNKALSYFLYIFIAILFVGIAGLTDGNGLDWNAYKDIMNEHISINDIWGHPQYEPLFLLSYKLFPTYSLFLFVFVCINLFLISKTIFKYSPYITISLFVYICVYYFLGIMGQIRQAFAISIIIFAWSYVEQRRFLIYILLAGLFHVSAFICLLYYVIPNHLLKKKYYLFVLLFVSFSYVFFQKFIFSLLDSFASGKVLYYLVNEEAAISISFLLYKILLFLLILFKIDKNNDSLFLNKILNIYFLSILLYLILSFSSSIGGRIILYFSITEILIIPYLFKFYMNMKFGALIFILFLSFNIYQYFSFLTSYSDIYIPYRCLLL